MLLATAPLTCVQFRDFFDRAQHTAENQNCIELFLRCNQKEHSSNIEHLKNGICGRRIVHGHNYVIDVQLSGPRQDIPWSMSKSLKQIF